MQCPDARPNQSPKRRGYAIYERPAPWQAEFVESATRFAREDGHEEDWLAYWRALRLAFPRVDPRRYRGIGRRRLEAWWTCFEPLLGQDLVDERELTAQRHLARVVEPGLPASGMTYASDEDLLPSFELAAQVHALVDDPLGFEIVRLSRFDPKRNRATLGFDVGYWGGDFSLICDTLIAPKWHPAPEEDYEALRVQTRRLNRHVLFDSEEAGWAFRHWYVQQPWAETEFEPGEIQVVRVDAIF